MSKENIYHRDHTLAQFVADAPYEIGITGINTSSSYNSPPTRGNYMTDFKWTKYNHWHNNTLIEQVRYSTLKFTAIPSIVIKVDKRVKRKPFDETVIVDMRNTCYSQRSLEENAKHKPPDIHPYPLIDWKTLCNFYDSGLCCLSIEWLMKENKMSLLVILTFFKACFFK